jgi:cytosine/adenosine deaminase-related metal-dependent hydrolase
MAERASDHTSVVLRGGTVLTLDAQHSVLPDADVLVTGDRIAGVRLRLAVPAGTREIDARDGIVLPGMIDTHRHMWQTAMRGYGADWTLTQYFVWYYLESGRHFRPRDVRAGNLLAAAEALDAGVTTCADWSHGLQTVAHAEAAVDALRAVPGRYVLAYGNIQQAPWEWSASPDFQAFARRMLDAADDRLGFQMAFDVTGDPAFPERAATRSRASSACPSRRTPGCGARPTTTASGSRTRRARAQHPHIALDGHQRVGASGTTHGG